MIHFTPTAGIFATWKNVYTFIFENQRAFWDLMKKIAPYLILFTGIAIATQYFGLKNLENIIADINTSVDYNNEEAKQQAAKEINAVQKDFIKFHYSILFICQLCLIYLSSAIAISWHRLVILGEKNYEPMNIFKPKKSELIFMLMLIVTSLVIGIMMLAISAPALGIAVLMKFNILGGATMVIGGLIAGITGLFVTARWSFYFPAKATNNSLTLGEAFSLSKGYASKLVITGILVVIPLYLVLLTAYAIPTTVLNNANIKENYYEILINILFTPLYTVFGVTVLSNYYQHALQNKGLPEAKSAADD